MQRTADPVLVGVYLNDHLAGSVAAAELADRIRSENADRPELVRAISGFRRDLDDERRFLEQVIEQVGARRSPVKIAAGWAVEKLSRLKLNGSIVTYSPLSRLLELEALIAGVRIKQALWRSLLAAELAALDPEELQRLEAQAERQIEELERFRTQAAIEAIVRA